MCYRGWLTATFVLLALVFPPPACFAQSKAHLAPGLDDDLTQIYQEANRLLVNVVVEPSGGLRVTSLITNSTAVKMVRADNQSQRGQLESGDIITKINSSRVNSLEGYYRLLDSSQDDLKVTVIDKNTSQAIEWIVTPAKVNVPIVPHLDNAPDDRIAHVLLIGLSHDQAGGAFGGNVELLEPIVRSGIAAKHLNLQTILGEDCRAAIIIRKLREMGAKSRPQDTIFVHYSGHGAYDPKYAKDDPSGGHFFQIPPEKSAPSGFGGDLLRKTLFDNLLLQPGRLKILISDSCNVRGVAHPFVMPKLRTRDMAVRGPTDLEQLLLYHQGYLDVDAASRDQYCWLTTSQHGFGWFTLQFARLFPHESNWPPLLENVSRKTNEYFLERRKYLLAHPSRMDPDDLEAIRNQTAQFPAVFRNHLEKDKLTEATASRVLHQKVVDLAPGNFN